MTGPWETKLTALADREGDWKLSGADDLETQLNALQPVLKAAIEQHGLTGTSGDAATASLAAAQNSATRILRAIQTVRQTMGTANQARVSAEEMLRALPEGQLDSGTAAAVSAVATGVTIFMGPISVVAGPTAVGWVNDWLANRREQYAQEYVQQVSDAIDRTTATQVDPGGDADGNDGLGDTELRKAGDASSTSTGAGSTKLPAGSTATASGTGAGSTGLGTAGATTSTGATGSPTASLPGISPITDHTAATGDGTFPGLSTDMPTMPSPTVDGPTNGTANLPNLSGAGLNGAPPAGLGSIPGLGDLGGIGGSALAGGLGAAAAIGADRLMSKGLGGGGGIGALGLGGIGGAGAAGAVGAGATNGGLGTSRTGKGAALSGAGAAADADAKPGAAGMMGGGGQGGAAAKKSGRGLGGPIAPKLAEDADVTQRSAAAGAGGRE